MCALLHLILCSCWTTCAALSSALHAGRSATPRPEVLEVDSAGGIKLHATTAAAVALSPGPAASQELVHTFPLLALLVFAMFEFGVLWELGLLGQMYDKLIEYAALVIFAAAAICTIVVQLSRIIYNVARRLADVAVRLEEQFMAYWRRLHSRLEGGLQSAKARMSNSCGPAFLWSRRHSLATAAPSGDPALSTMTPQSSADATPTGAAST
eukprot:TRINITY_DN1723_c0_g1_i2.p1 TRINITY_DN1723_c0_g1~~TRINITY_DN1723_c0_g1_i2.p1  ORF type:complete len:211 (-),score=28.12 TRINITY_DN1723_c0_g1_i2:326-958(-)